MSILTGIASNAELIDTNKSWKEFIEGYSPATIKLPLKEEDKKQYKRMFMPCAIGGKVKDNRRNNANIINRDLLALDLDYIAIKDYDKLQQQIEKTIEFHAYIYPTISCQEGHYRYRIIIPIEDGAINNKDEYRTALMVFLNRAKEDGIINKIDVSNLTWSQVFGLPILTQYTPKKDLQQLVREIQGEPLTIGMLKQLIINYQQQKTIYEEQADYDFAHGYLNDKGAEKTVAEFVKRHTEWLKDYNNYLACQFEIKYAEQHKEINHEQALKLVTILANGNEEWEKTNRIKYERENKQINRGKGLAYFVSKKQAHYLISWLRYDDDHVPHIDYHKLALEINKEYPYLNNDTLPTQQAIYADGHWNFHHVDEKIRSIISDKMHLANVWDRNKRFDEFVYFQDCFYSISDEMTQINANPYYVQGNNCTIDVRTMETHPNTAKDYIPNYHKFNYHHEYLDENKRLKKEFYPKTTLRWLQFLTQSNDNVNFLLTLIGYCFINTYQPSQVITFLNGGGGNGKSTFLNYLIELLDSHNVSDADLDQLANPNLRFVTSKLLYKNANIFADINNKKLKNFSKIKTLSGGDNIMAEFKGGKFFEFKNYAKLIFSANEVPIFEDLSEAVLRRIRIIDFPQRINNSNIQEVMEKYPLETIYSEKDKMIMLCLQKIHDFLNGERSLLAPNGYMQKSINSWLKKADLNKVFTNEYLISVPEDLELIKEHLHINERKSIGETLKMLYQGYRLIAQKLKQKYFNKQEFLTEVLKSTPDKIFNGDSGVSLKRKRYMAVFSPDFFATMEEYNEMQDDDESKIDLNQFTFYDYYKDGDYTNDIFKND